MVRRHGACPDGHEPYQANQPGLFMHAGAFPHPRRRPAGCRSTSRAPSPTRGRQAADAASQRAARAPADHQPWPTRAGHQATSASLHADGSWATCPRRPVRHAHSLFSVSCARRRPAPAPPSPPRPHPWRRPPAPLPSYQVIARQPLCRILPVAAAVSTGSRPGVPESRRRP